MSKFAYCAAAFAAGSLTVAIILAFASQKDTDSKDPVLLAPNMYKVVLDNDQLRAIDYHLKPGEKEPMHSHPNGVFVYYFTDADTRGTDLSGATTETHHKAGDVLWREPVTHVAENIGKTEIHQLLVEPKQHCNHTEFKDRRRLNVRSPDDQQTRN
jgi:beta-alanine degradation protein BauB